MKFPISYLAPTRDHKKVQLDKVGTIVYRACDGTKTVEKITEEFADMFCLRFHESRLAVMEFLKMLMEKGIIIIAVNQREQQL